MPWAAGGPTDIANAQALCPDCNNQKGATVEKPLRRWQERALSKYSLADPRDWLVVATPGAGKTRLAGELLHRYIVGGVVTRVIIVVPTERLKVQWADSLAALGVNVTPSWENGHGVMPTDMHGVAVTYAQVAADRMLFRKHTADRRTFVVLDEIHHCGEKKRWGDDLRFAFEPAERRLALSGTPFRADNNAIPFVNYVDGRGVGDDHYGYGEALADGVCRPVYFPKTGGLVEWNAGGATLRHSFDDELSERGESQRLLTVLRVGEWLPSVIRDAHTKLSDLRSAGDHDAAGLVLATDEDHARAVARIVKRVVGVDPVVVTSKEADASKTIDRFARGVEPWLVAIKMVSEGVDIPRLRVGVYATNVTSELFFRQAVGRLVRVEEDGPDAHMFIPDDARLVALALKIKKQREDVLVEQERELEERRLSDRDDVPSSFVPLSSTAAHGGVLFDGEQFDADEIDWINRIRLQDPQTAAVEPAVFAKFLRRTGITMPGPRTPPIVDEQPLYKRRDDLRTAVSRQVKRLGYRLGVPFGQLHFKLNAATGCKTLPTATEEQMRRQLDLIREWDEAGGVPGG